MSVEIVAGVASGAGAALGWLARHFRNGNSKVPSEQVLLLRDIAKNTSALPDMVRELRDYMAEGRIAMSRIERLDREIK